MQENIKQLFQHVNQILDKYEEISKISGDNFNIFKTINLTTDEVRIHSNFLAELLNPKGSHGQYDIFLKLFIEEFSIKDFDTETANVFVEKYIGKTTETHGGRIDILIENQDKKKIIIENKIYASDQPNQLIRYHNYSSENIFYLTLYGSKPTAISIGHLQVDKDYKLLSYKNDIQNWLEKCKKEAVNLPLLREGISHYIHLIKHLTGESTNKTMEKEIRDSIAKTPENIKSAIKVSASLEQAKIKIQYLFWEALKEELEQEKVQYFPRNANKKLDWQTISKYYLQSRNNKYFGLWYKIFDNKKGITIHYGIEIDHSIYQGFTIERNNGGGISNNKEFEAIREIIIQIDEKYQSNNYWLGWKHAEPRLNFREFNSEAIFNLADRKNLQQTVINIVNNSIQDIELLKEKLKNITIV
jgi:hypothetical protein